MLRCAVVAIVALAATPLWGDQERPRIDRARLEWFKSLSPEKKKELREKLEAIKKLPPEERQRLLENLKRWRGLPEDVRKQLQEKMQQLTPEEKKIYGDLTQRYFKEIGVKSLKAFPRELFFMWLRSHRAVEMERIRYVDPPERRELFDRLCAEFQALTLQRFEEHQRVHKCAPADRVEELRRAEGPDFWVKWKALMEEARASHPHRPTDVRDRRLPPPKREGK